MESIKNMLRPIVRYFRNMGNGTNKRFFREAEALYFSGKYKDAEIIYQKNMKNKRLGGACHYRLAQIANRNGQPLEAYKLFYKALELSPNLYSFIRFTGDKNHPTKNYIFKGKQDELTLECCQICGNKGEPIWSYPMPESSGYSEKVNPIKLWSVCKKCNHIFTNYLPAKLSLFNDGVRNANPTYFSLYTDILSTIRSYTEDVELLEVGIGAGECALVAREMGFNVIGMDIIEKHVDKVRRLYGLSTITCDFLEFSTDKKFDIIMMGDVLEHIDDPVPAIEKANELLNVGGVLWVSTPNFESAISYVKNFQDPMRFQTFHINYFSRESLYKLLEMKCFKPVNYKLSQHYGGSMEVIAIKQANNM